MSDLTASLPMYSLPEMAGANAALWAALRRTLGEDATAGMPGELLGSSPAATEVIGPETVFSQACGYPLQTIYRDQFQMVGTPHYDAPGCHGAMHTAFIVVRQDSRYAVPGDLRGTVFALNSRHSNTGMNLPRLLFARLAGGRPFFSGVVETGSHMASMEAVTRGDADAASIDCVTYAFFADHRPEAIADLRVIAETPDSPSLPFITAAGTAPARVTALRDALTRLSDDPQNRPVLDALRIAAISPADPERYRVLLGYEREAEALGYPVLA